MTEARTLLREVMESTSTSQAELARLSGVHQPSISQALAGTLGLSDDQLGRLLSCMGRQLAVSRTAIVPDLTRSERRSWQLHLELSRRLSRETLAAWEPRLRRNVVRMRARVQGEPHTGNVARWEALILGQDVSGMHRAMTGLDRDSIEMREVSPFGGILTEAERLDIVTAGR